MINTLQPLDILLYKGKDFTSWLIEVGTSSPYSHVAVVTDPQISLGIESNTGHQSGVRAFDLRKIQINEVDVYRIKPEFQSKVNRQKVVSFLVGHLEAKYDWWGVIRLAFLKILGLIPVGLTKKWHNNFQRNKDYFCSELCYAAFNSAGLDIVPQVDSAAIRHQGISAKVRF